MTVTAPAKRRRREARLDSRFGARVCEKGPLGVKNAFLDNTSKKSDARRPQRLLVARHA